MIFDVIKKGATIGAIGALMRHICHNPSCLVANQQISESELAELREVSGDWGCRDRCGCGSFFRLSD